MTGLTGGGLPDEAFAAALASLPQMFPARLSKLLSRWRPGEAWRRVLAGTWCSAFTGPGLAGQPEEATVEVAPGRLSTAAAAWRGTAAAVDVAQVWAGYRAAGVGVALRSSPAMPAALAGDLDPPGVVFTRGDLTVPRSPVVAIVGTRTATRYGLDVAAELGSQLAAAGVVVVSGLAAGIDAAAHRGALAVDGAAPVAVVGSGPDVVYPRANHRLWQAVAERGLLLSEAPLGGRPERWRFPARNRLIAALADAVVVVESHQRGGSLLTVTEAQRRSIPVLAVPGPIRSSASAGANRLLADGATPVCDVGDVLVCLDLSPAARRGAVDRRPPPGEHGQVLLDAMAWQPASLESLAIRTGLGLADLAAALATLQADGWIELQGGWFERVCGGQ